MIYFDDWTVAFNSITSAMFTRLARGVLFLIGAAFEPIGIGLKAVAAAFLILDPSPLTLLCLLAALSAVATVLVATMIQASDHALGILLSYIRQRGSDWIRTAPFTPEELYSSFSLRKPVFSISPSPFPLYLVTYAGNHSLDCRCYLNIAGPSFILSPNAIADFHSLPPAQQFVIYHELGHASAFGGELWTKQVTDLVTAVGALVFAAASTSHWPWWAVVLGLTGVVISGGQASEVYRTESAETFADRYGLKMLATTDIKNALKVADQLSNLWKRTLQHSGDLLPNRRRLELKARLTNISRQSRALKRLDDGVYAFDVDRIPTLFQALPSYVWAAILFVWVVREGSASESWSVPMALGCFTIAIAVSQAIRIPAMASLRTREREILNHTRWIGPENEMIPQNAVTKELLRKLDDGSANFMPEPYLDHVIEAVMNGDDIKDIVKEAGTEDSTNPSFISLEPLKEVLAIVYAVKATWDLVSFFDKATDVALKREKQLEIAQKVVTHLREAGLNVTAERVQGWIDIILERLTRPEQAPLSSAKSDKVKPDGQ